MKGRLFSRAILSAVLLILAAGSGLARGLQPSGPSEAADASTGFAGYGPWVVEVVDSAINVGSHVSIAISPHSGTTYISYYDAYHDNLKMATYVGAGGNCGPSGNWSCETVDSVGDVGKYSSIAINPTIDLPVISYYDATNESLKLAEWLGVSWYVRTIDDPYGSVGTHTSLKIDSSGVPHIAYHAKDRDLQPDRLFYATRASGSTSLCTNGDFQCDPIDTAYAGYTSLDLNSHGHIGIAYQINKRLKYARFVSPGGGNCGLGGSGWSCTYLQGILLPDACATSYVSLDHDDGSHGAHVASYCGFLNYEKYVGTGGNCVGADAWQCDEIDTMGDTPHTRDVSLVVDHAGLPIIAYHTYKDSGFFTIVSLNVARPAAALAVNGNCGSQNDWRCDRIPDIGDPGDYLAIAVNPSGLATVAYNNIIEGFGSLRVAYQPPFKVYLPLSLKSFAAP